MITYIYMDRALLFGLKSALKVCNALGVDSKGSWSPAFMVLRTWMIILHVELLSQMSASSTYVASLSLKHPFHF